MHEEFNKANEEGILMYEKTINGFISETRKKFKNLMSTGNYYLINNERRNFNSKIDLIDSLINSKQVDLLNLIPHATLFYKVRFEGKKRKLDKEATLTREEILDNGKLTINIYDENDPFNAILEIPKPIYKITIANGELVKTFKVNNGKILNIEECFNNECDYFREKESVFSSINSHESYLKSGSLIRSELGWLALDSKESNGKISFIDMGNNQIYYMDILKINNKIQEVETSYSMYSGNEMLLNKLYAFNIY
ncbi:hypothetical protein [Muriicola soli]|uniref:Uncharacterized protein n=1 Tax=Muriicola soli TaxID=2507538 RepID=A0A411E824_9FLAO|nr:hypothetical protein [Muriicola soli]QBA63673.1 hypothetical protein EQY75_03390 [Muriicola soli]